jgi:psiF repeat
MKKLTAVIAIGFTLTYGLLSAPAHAADGDKTAQQSRMGMCNNNATGKKGDERKAFMKECLSAKKEVSPQAAQQGKMKTCNVEAKGKKGDERKSFMKECLGKTA